MGKKIIVWGEVLKRISPVCGCCPFGFENCHIALGDVLDTPSLGHCQYNGNACQISFGGSELNAGAALKRYGFDVAMVTKLSDDEWGEAALYSLRSHGIDTSFVKKGTQPLGAYLTEKVEGRLALKATYNRKHSVMAMAEASDFNLEEIFKDACWFHLSGITPALSPTLREITLEAMKYAKKHHISTSFDVNYRPALFSSIEEAKEVLQPFVHQTDVLFVNEQEIKVLGIDVDGNKLISPGVFSAVCNRLIQMYPELKIIAHAQRTQLSVDECRMRAIYWWDGVIPSSQTYQTKVIDSVGAGDAFAAALIATILWQRYGDMPDEVEPLFKIDFATVASTLKHTFAGDINLATIEEIAEKVKNPL